MSKISIKPTYDIRFSLTSEEITALIVILTAFKGLAENTDLVTKQPRAVTLTDLLLDDLKEFI